MKNTTLGDAPQPCSSALAQQVYEELHQRILDGRLPAGADVPDSVIAKQMGVSRAPVRDACNMLVQAGLLTKRLNYPYQVRRWAQKDLGELNLIRWGYESAAVRHLVQTDQPLEGVEQALAGMDAALERRDAAMSFRADLDFHFALVASAGFPELTRLHRLIGERILLMPLPDNLPPYLLEQQRPWHQEILDVLAESRRSADPGPIISCLSRHMLAYRVVPQEGHSDWSSPGPLPQS
ncbi:GntR family transcriptional regulator [Streptomyces olivaceoviridis]